MSNFLNKLLDKTPLTNSEEDYFLSLYYPVTDRNRSDIKTHVKSFLLEALRNDKDLKEKTLLHHNLVESILQRLDPIAEPSLERGFGMFIQFNSDKQDKGRHYDITEENIEVMRFSKTPEKEIFIGNVYDLGQLIWIENAHSDAIVLSLNEQECSIYEIDGDQILKITSLEHTELEDRHESLKLFLKEVFEFLDSSLSFFPSKIDHLAILYSNSFEGIIKESVNEYLTAEMKPIPLFIDKNINDPEQILETVRSEITKSLLTAKKHDIEIAKESFNEYCEGWSDTLNAINMKQVAKLFIRSRATKPGYINTETTFIYTYPEKDSVKIHDIAPRAIKAVLDGGGEIVILRERDKAKYPVIAAQLRYPIKRQDSNNEDEIKTWVEQRKGNPAIVKSTQDLLRIRFAEDESELEVVSWDHFFDKLKENKLLFIYDNSPDSRFCAFVNKGK